MGTLEVLNGHPLYKYGLKAYAFQLVENSLWIEKLKRMNRIHPMHVDSIFDSDKHFIYTFHDSCIEVICESYFYEISNGKRMKELIAEKIQLL